MKPKPSSKSKSTRKDLSFKCERTRSKTAKPNESILTCELIPSQVDFNNVFSILLLLRSSIQATATYHMNHNISSFVQNHLTCRFSHAPKRALLQTSRSFWNSWERCITLKSNWDNFRRCVLTLFSRIKLCHRCLIHQWNLLFSCLSTNSLLTH